MSPQSQDTTISPSAHTVEPAGSLRARVERGRAARRAAPRSSHSQWAPSPSRQAPVAQLREQELSRLPELLPIRHGRMAASPFAFFRGAATIMAADLSGTPMSGIGVQLCGDAHLANFGVFASPEREMVFDINDFDETLRGPWEWDLKRLVASVEIAGRNRGFTDRERRVAARSCAERYVESIKDFARMANLEVWYSRLPVRRIVELMREQGFAAKRTKAVQRSIEKAESKDSRRAAMKFTERVDGHLRFVSRPPLIVPVAELLTDAERAQLEETMSALLASYRESLPHDRRALFDEYRFLSLARKVVGVGSVGTRAWMVLLCGRDEDDPLVLQCKEAEASVFERYAGASPYENHGRRVVEGQRLMQAASDIFLGWLPAVGVDGKQRDFYMRQLWDGKLSLDVESIRPEGLTAYGQLCAWTLARAHARTGDRVAIAAYLGGGRSFAEAIADFAASYADCNEADHASLISAIGAGELVAEEA